VESGETEPLFEEEVLVEAEWAPDGEQFAYVLATDETYELRWRTPNGEDKLLASDVAFTFSISPNGDQVAFTRESNYEVDGQPGFYVVDVATGTETMLTDVDRAGTGSLEDKPVWSPSGEHVLLPTYGMSENADMLRAAADGSDTVPLQFDPSLSGKAGYEMTPFSAMWVEDTKVIGTALLHGPDSPMGGEPTVLLYELNKTLDTVVAGRILAEGVLIGWDVPGTSVWVQVGSEMQSIPLSAI
jgi:dipeptidyl aminopeptidase/acylaminoacyl peptidase